jgi:ankyrin repeat protein/class 3 adenylate cyclase
MGIVKEFEQRKPFNDVVASHGVDSKSSSTTKQRQTTTEPPKQVDDISFEELWFGIEALRTVEEKLLYAVCNGEDSVSHKAMKDVLEGVQQPISLDKIRDTQNQNASLLHCAVKRNKVHCLELLVQHKATVDCVDSIGATPLIHAVVNNCVECVASLIASGANINTKDHYNKCALLLALKNRNYEIAGLLRKCDVHLKGIRGNTALHTMAEEGDLQAVQFLIETLQASPFRRNQDEDHVLFTCLQHLEIVDYICQVSKPILVKMLMHENCFGRTIFHECCERGNFDSLLIILKHVGTLSPKQVTNLLNNADQKGDTPLILAVNKNRYDIVEFLCRCEEVQINEADGHGFTALAHAANVKDKQLTTTLTKYGGSINVSKDEDSIHEKSNSRLCNILFSIRFSMMLSAMIQVLVCCFAIWITSFSLSYTSQQKLSKKFMNEVSQKVVYFIDKTMMPSMSGMNLLKDFYQSGILEADDSARLTLFNMAKQYQSLAIGIGEAGRNNYHSVETYVNGGAYLSYSWQSLGDNDAGAFKSFNLNNQTGAIASSAGGLSNFFVKTRSWYTEAINNPIGVGLWEPIFWSSAYTGFAAVYAVPIGRNGTKEGVVKTNVALTKLVSYMMEVELLGRGYVHIVEGNGNLIASSLDLSALLTLQTRTSIYNVTDLNTGSVAKEIRKRLGTGTLTVQTEKNLKISAEGSRYQATIVPYKIDNLQWTVMVILYDSDLYSSLYVAIYVSICIAVIVLLVGVTMALLSGYIMTQPLMNLMREFKKVANMDLDNVNKLNSSFTEVAQIYKALEDMTTWLREFRAFLPESVLKASNINLEKKTQHGSSTDVKKQDDSSTISGSTSSSGAASITFSRRNKFKLGLAGKVATVLVIGIEDVDQFYSLPPVDLVHAYSLLFKQVSSIVGHTKGIIQVLPQSLSMWVYYDGNGQESRAVQAALEIIEYTKQLSQQLVKEQYPPLNVSCGIHTSHVLAGNMGVSNQKLFTVVGSLLKRTEQLQAYASQAQLRLVATENTFNKCSQKFIGRPVDIIRIEDNENIPIYEICKGVDTKADDWVNEIDSNKKAPTDLDSYIHAYTLLTSYSNSTKAKQLFGEYLTKHPKDVPTQDWLQLIERIEENELLASASLQYHSSNVIAVKKNVCGYEFTSKEYSQQN